MAADLTLYIDLARQLFVASPATLQPLSLLNLIQAENVQVGVQMLNPTGNGLAPFVNVDPTGWTLNFALGYIDTTGTKQLIAQATSTALTAISGLSANTALLFTMNLATSSASALLSSVHSANVWAEAGWSTSGATTAYQNKAQVLGTIKTGYVGVGLPFTG